MKPNESNQTKAELLRVNLYTRDEDYLYQRLQTSALYNYYFKNFIKLFKKYLRNKTYVKQNNL